jgi:hypothetical protein
LAVFFGTVYNFPAGYQGIDAFDTVDANLRIVDCPADTLDSFDIGLRKKALVRFLLKRNYQAFPLVHPQCVN